MASMNVSLPDPMKDWVEAQARTGRYSNASDYVRDLIWKDQERAAKIVHLRQLVTDALESGVEQAARREAEVGDTFETLAAYHTSPANAGKSRAQCGFIPAGRMSSSILPRRTAAS
jgi:antitoxin ParD1/3/4